MPPPDTHAGLSGRLAPGLPQSAAYPHALCDRALALHRAGDLAAAEPLYRAALAADPAHFQSLHLLGLLRAMRGDPAGALPLLDRALTADPGHGFVHSNRGNALVELGRAEEALAAFDQALAISPDLVEAWIGRGNALQALGRPAEALAAMGQAELRGADMPALHNNRGNALRALHRAEEALPCYDAAIVRDPLYAAAHANRATALSDLDREEEALASVAIALMLRPGDPGFLIIQGVILRVLARPQEALASFDQALSADPASVEAQAGRMGALCDLHRYEEALETAEEALENGPGARAHRHRAATLSLLGRHAEAEAAERAALAADPSHAEAWNGRGNALIELGRFEQALECFDRAGELRPGHRAIPYNRGNALRGLGRHEEAIAHFRQAAVIDPRFADAHWNEALSLLALGELRAGFEKYEWRWRRKGHRPHRHAAAPLWRGERLEGHTLLLHAEQGLGDTIQMARYLPMVAARADRIVLEAPRALWPLLRGIGGIAELVAVDERVRPHDVQCPLMSLPLAFGTDRDGRGDEAVPPPLAFPVEAGRAAAWAARCAAGLPPGTGRIGIACSGNPAHLADRHRSIPLSVFAPLLGEGRQGFLIQTDLREGDAAFLRETAGITDLRPELGSFMETAAALMAMDVVVCVDTSVAHLAASLGRPVHLLVPPLADWRWMTERTDSPWYPSLRLHRRARQEGWEEVMARVVSAVG